jgi:CRP-like cAMP-binding protein
MTMAKRHCIPEMLSHQALFRCLEVDELERLARGAHEQRIGRNEFLYQKGEIPQGLHLVISGQVKLALPSAEGVEKIVLMAGPGDTFAEEAVFPERHSPVAAQANKDSILLVLDRHSLRAAMRSTPDLVDGLMSRMAERMCQLIENLETCVQRSSAQRVAHFLSQRAPEQAISFDLELDVNKSTIASQLNLAPETFSRVLSRLSRDGLIDMKGRCITLRNLSSLRSFAG